MKPTEWLRYTLRELARMLEGYEWRRRETAWWVLNLLAAQGASLTMDDLLHPKGSETTTPDELREDVDYLRQKALERGIITEMEDAHGNENR